MSNEPSHFCAGCFEHLDWDAPWPDNGVHEDGLHLHERCVAEYRLERAEGHLA